MGSGWGRDARLLVPGLYATRSGPSATKDFNVFHTYRHLYTTWRVKYFTNISKEHVHYLLSVL